MVKFYDWDTDARGHIWSYEKEDGPWCSRTAYDALAAHAKALEETLRSAHSELTDHGHQELGECECRIAYVLGTPAETKVEWDQNEDGPEYVG